MSGPPAPGAPAEDRIGKDTTLCISLAARPSSVGTRFHNHLYAQLGLDFVYKAMTTADLPGAVAGIRALGIRGCGVSMPFKQEIIGLLDAVAPSAEAIGAVNTVVNDGGHLTGYNTDVIAVRDVLPSGDGPDARTAVVAGSGGMAAAAVAALRAAGYGQVTVMARNDASGRLLAERFGCRRAAFGEPPDARVLVNATPIGMAGAPEAAGSPFSARTVARADTVVDVVATPPHTPLITLAGSHGARTVTGDAIMALQAAEQFALYTGVRPTDAQVRAAQRHSRRPGAPALNGWEARDG